MRVGLRGALARRRPPAGGQLLELDVWGPGDGCPTASVCLCGSVCSRPHLDQADEPILVPLARGCLDPALRPLLGTLRCVILVGSVRSVLSLFEQQQERLPPVLMADTFLAYDDLPWVAPFSVHAQLKRMADLLIAGLLLMLTAPFVFWLRC